MDRAAVLSVAWQAAQWQFPEHMTEQRFVESLHDWEAWPVVVGGELAGAVLVRRTEIHCCILPAYFRRWATPALYRRVLRHKQQHGRLTTSVNIEHMMGRDFVERFGFKLIGNYHGRLVYEMR